jgi:hypothetical protein
MALSIPNLRSQVLYTNSTIQKNNEDKLPNLKVFDDSESNAPFRYEPIPGKLIGILTPEAELTVDKLSDYRINWGFSGIFVYPLLHYGTYSSIYYDNAIAAGFLPSNILVMVNDIYYNWGVKNLPAGYYFIDELVEHDCYGRPSSPSVSHIYTPNELSEIRNYIKLHQPSAKFAISGYKRCSHLIAAGNYADIVMYSSYENWNEFTLFGRVCHVNIGWADNYEFPWFSGNNLQVDSWNDMRAKFGSKFSMTWMDYIDEFSALFHRANVLGLNGIWLYALKGITTSQLRAFCDAATENGWMRKIDDGFIEAPSNLTAAAPSVGEVILNWNDNSNNELGFVIERRGNSSSSFIEISRLRSNQTNYVDTTVGEGITYDYRVRAYNAYTYSMYSNEVKITSKTQLKVPTLLFPDNGAINQPTTLRLIWVSIPEVLGYRIQLATNDHFQNLILDSILTENQIEVLSLNNKTDYYWRVNALYNIGTSFYSEIWRFTTIIAATTTPVLLQPENGASNLYHPIFLNWSTSRDAENYRVQLAIDSMFIFLVIDDSTVVDTIFLIANLFEGQIYFWRVRSQNVAGASNFSEAWSFKTWLPPPRHATASSIEMSKVLLSWKDMSERESGFIIEKKLGDTTSLYNYFVLDTVGTNTTTFLDTIVNQSTKYSYRLFAFNEYTKSEYSNQTQVTTLTNVKSGANIPDEFYIYQNYPNPFNSMTTIKSAIPTRGNINISISNALGQIIFETLNVEVEPGYHSFNFDAGQLPSGIYFYSVQFSNFWFVRKMIVLK